MTLSATFAALAGSFGEVWLDATARWQGAPSTDAGGSITAAGTPVNASCKVQFDSVTDAMRADADFRDRDVRILILRNGLSRIIEPTASIIVASGDHAGTWAIRSSVSDPAGVGFDCRARKVP